VLFASAHKTSRPNRSRAGVFPEEPFPSAIWFFSSLCMSGEKAVFFFLSFLLQAFLSPQLPLGSVSFGAAIFTFSNFRSPCAPLRIPLTLNALTTQLKLPSDSLGLFGHPSLPVYMTVARPLFPPSPSVLVGFFPEGRSVFWSLFYPES